MTQLDTQSRCIIVGASHAGVSCAFALRQHGYDGEIVVIDTDCELPYHRPPLSKAFLLDDDLNSPPAPLKSMSAYEKANITLLTGTRVQHIDRAHSCVTICRCGDEENAPNNTRTLNYTSLVLATGASAIIPPIEGMDSATNCFVMRSSSDARQLKRQFLALKQLKNTDESVNVVAIGAGYIGLETAASLCKAGASVTVIEREPRILARASSPAVSDYVSALHEEHGVKIITSTQVNSIVYHDEKQWVTCSNNERYCADIILLGVGVKANTGLAQDAGLALHPQGIQVDERMQTSDSAIWAIGDCTVFPHQKYQQHNHIESVQNALSQAKVAAASICQKSALYNDIPWFWSDQFNTKLQMVGLRDGADSSFVRRESKHVLSVWHFNQQTLVSVEAINCPKAYVLAGRWIAQQATVNKEKLVNSAIELKQCVN